MRIILTLGKGHLKFPGFLNAKGSDIMLLLDIVEVNLGVKEDFAMQTFYRLLWSLAILAIAVTTIIVSFWFILIGAAVVSLLGIYRYYIMKKRFRQFKTKPYTSGEVIDLQAEVIHETIQAKKPDEFK